MRLNPFAFPSDTTFRFLLFIAANIGISLLAFDWLYSQFADLGAEARGLYECLLGMNAPVGQLPTDEQQSAFLSCMAAVNEPDERRSSLASQHCSSAVRLPTSSPSPCSAAATARFARRMRPSCGPRSTPLSGEAGLTSSPGLRWQPVDARALGLAFGPPGRRELAFTGGLVPLAVRDPPAFRSIVLHELAHIRNRDVDLAYYAIGIWRALVVVAIIPFVVTLLDELLSDPGIVGSFGWRLLALVPLVYLVRAGILRAREHDADVRASTHEPEIRRVLGAAADAERQLSSTRDTLAHGGDGLRGTRPSASALRSSTTLPRSFVSGCSTPWASASSGRWRTRRSPPSSGTSAWVRSRHGVWRRLRSVRWSA